MTDRAQITLKRLVSRLEATSKAPPSSGDPLAWCRATSTLSTVQYARKLLNEAEAPSAGPSRPRADSLHDLEQRLDKIEATIKAVRDAAPPPPLPDRLPVELKPATPKPPLVPMSPTSPPKALAEAAGPAQDLLPVEDDILGPVATSPPTPARPTPARSATSTKDVSSLLSHHREVQDELANDLAGMARQLKLNSLHFAGSLEKDKAALGGIETRLEGNLTGMKAEKTRLDGYSKQGGVTTCFVITAVMGVAMAWMFIFALIRIS